MEQPLGAKAGEWCAPKGAQGKMRSSEATTWSQALNQTMGNSVVGDPLPKESKYMIYVHPAIRIAIGFQQSQLRFCKSRHNFPKQTGQGAFLTNGQPEKRPKHLANSTKGNSSLAANGR